MFVDNGGITVIYSLFAFFIQSPFEFLTKGKGLDCCYSELLVIPDSKIQQLGSRDQLQYHRLYNKRYPYISITQKE